MDTVCARVADADDTGSWGDSNDTSTVPADAEIYFALNAARSGAGHGPTTAATGGVTGTGDRFASLGTYYTLEANNFINEYHLKADIDVTITGNSTVNSAAFVLTYSEEYDRGFPCYYNFVQQHVNGTGDTLDYAFVKATATAVTAVDNFRDPVLYNSTSTASYDNKVAGGGISDEDFDGRAADFTANTGPADTALAKFVLNFEASGRGDKDPSTQGTSAAGSLCNFASFTQDSVAYNGVTEWESLRTSCSALGTACAQRVIELDARIGVPVYGDSHPSTDTGTTPATRSNPPRIRVKTIPTANTTNGYAPYGREIYDNVNLLLGQDVDLLGGIIKDVESLTDLVQLVKNARNKYEIYNGRAKEY
jgi:hypothetical protein